MAHTLLLRHYGQVRDSRLLPPALFLPIVVERERGSSPLPANQSDPCSFIVYGIVLEYATSDGKKLHELSLIFVTSLLYSVTAYIGRMVRNEEPTTIPKEQMLVLGMTSMGSTFTSVRSLRYVIYPVQVLAKSCKPIPVMLMGLLFGKRYPTKKYANVILIVFGVALFMGSGGKGGGKAGTTPGGQLLGLLLLFMSLCFDGGTGAYEDKLMRRHRVGAFDLMFNIQFAKMLLAGLALIITGQINFFGTMVTDNGPILLLLGFSGAMGQVFIFICISKFGALTVRERERERERKLGDYNQSFLSPQQQLTMPCHMLCSSAPPVFHHWSSAKDCHSVSIHCDLWPSG
jgi:hypothetical protein